VSDLLDEVRRISMLGPWINSSCSFTLR
jgi:hypothetical protein